MEGSVSGLGGNLGSLDPKEEKEAAEVEKKMSFDLVAEFMKKTREELLQLADLNQRDQKICMLEKELLQIKDAGKVKDDKIGMMEDEILQLKADGKEIDGKIEAAHEAIESLDHRLVAKNQRILLLEDHIAVVNTRDEAAVEKARVKATTTPNFKKLAIFVGVSILVALATKKLGFFTYLKKEPGHEDGYVEEAKGMPTPRRRQRGCLRQGGDKGGGKGHVFLFALELDGSTKNVNTYF